MWTFISIAVAATKDCLLALLYVAFDNMKVYYTHKCVCFNRFAIIYWWGVVPCLRLVSWFRGLVRLEGWERYNTNWFSQSYKVNGLALWRWFLQHLERKPIVYIGMPLYRRFMPIGSGLSQTLKTDGLMVSLLHVWAETRQQWLALMRCGLSEVID